MATTPANKSAANPNYMDQLFSWLSDFHHNIEGLGVGIPCSMNALCRFNQLRELSYSGFSTTSDCHSGCVFAQLHRLEALDLLYHKPCGRQSSAGRIPPSAIARTRPLKRFSIREEYKHEHENEDCGCNMLYRGKIRNAFWRVHSQSVGSLTVTCRQSSRKPRLLPMYLLTISATSLQTLALDLGELDGAFLWMLPSSLERVNLSLRSWDAEREEVYFNSIHFKLPALQRTCFTLVPLIVVKNDEGTEAVRIYEDELYRLESCNFWAEQKRKMGSGLAGVVQSN